VARAAAARPRLATTGHTPAPAWNEVAPRTVPAITMFNSAMNALEASEIAHPVPK